MDKKQFEAKKAIVDKHRGLIDELMASIEKEYGESQLAEAEQPKLRNGDVYTQDSFVVVVRYRSSEWEVTHRDGSRLIGDAEKISDHLRNFTFSHNIFDDLKALAEPLKNFELDETFISGMLDGQMIRLSDRGETSYLPLAKVRELVLYLRRLLHTSEQAKNKD